MNFIHRSVASKENSCSMASGKDDVEAGDVLLASEGEVDTMELGPQQFSEDLKDNCCYYVCSTCTKTSDTEKGMISHLATHNSTPSEMIYQCQQCRLLFNTMQEMVSHSYFHDEDMIEVKHDERGKLKGFQCYLCSKIIGTKGNLTKHLQLHNGLKPFLCKFCGKEFSLKGNRDKHELIHTALRPHTCQICGKSFTLKGNLHKHVLTHTKMKFFKCEVCQKEFTLKGNLDKHLRRHEIGMLRLRHTKPKNCNGWTPENKLFDNVDFNSTAEEQDIKTLPATEVWVKHVTDNAQDECDIPSLGDVNNCKNDTPAVQLPDIENDTDEGSVVCNDPCTPTDNHLHVNPGFSEESNTFKKDCNKESMYMANILEGLNETRAIQIKTNSGERKLYVLTVKTQKKSEVSVNVSDYGN